MLFQGVFHHEDAKNTEAGTKSVKRFVTKDRGNEVFYSGDRNDLDRDFNRFDEIPRVLLERTIGYGMIIDYGMTIGYCSRR